MSPLSVTRVEQVREINGRGRLEQMPLPTELVSFSETTPPNN